MSRTKTIVSIVALLVCLCVVLFLAFAVKLSQDAKRITAYDNPNPNVPALHAAVARDPRDAAAWMNLGRYDYMHHNYGAAIPELQQVTRTEPEDSSSNSEALMLLGAAFKKTGHPADYLATVRRLATHHDEFGRNARQYLTQHGG